MRPRAAGPKPGQQPHPPMGRAGPTPPTFGRAGRSGLGFLCFTIGEPGELANLISTYRKAVAQAEPVGSFVNEQAAGFTALHCGPEDATARQRGGAAAVWYLCKLFEYFGEFATYAGYRRYRRRAEQ